MGSGGVALSATPAFRATAAPRFVRAGGAYLNLAPRLELPTRGVVTAVTWSPDGSALAAASWYGEDLTVWSRSGSVVSKFKRIGGGPYPESYLAFVNGSSELLFPPPETPDNSTCLDVWSVGTGEVTRAIVGPAPDSNNYAQNRARYFVVSPDQKIAAAAPGVGGLVGIYETKNWKVERTIKIDYGVASIGLFPDKSRVAVGALTRGHFLIADGASGAITADFGPYEVKFLDISFRSIAVSPDGEFIATGIGVTVIPGEYVHSPEAARWDKLVKPSLSIWRVEDGSFVAGLQEARSPIQHIAWDPKNRFVACIDDSSTLFIWESPSSRSAVSRIPLEESSMCLSVNPQGDRLAVGDGPRVRVYEIS